MATQFVTPPPHVAPGSMRHCELFDRKLTYDNPHEVIIPKIHEGPPVFFADNIMFRQPGWVVRRHADLKNIFGDSEHFSKNGSSAFSKLIGEDWVVMPTELDKPHHTAFRSAVNPLFSPSKMMGWQDKVSQRATESARFSDIAWLYAALPIASECTSMRRRVMRGWPWR